MQLKGPVRISQAAQYDTLVATRLYSRFRPKYRASSCVLCRSVRMKTKGAKLAFLLTELHNNGVVRGAVSYMR
jgi:hypothetical protein